MSNNCVTDIWSRLSRHDLRMIGIELFAMWSALKLKWIDVNTKLHCVSKKDTNIIDRNVKIDYQILIIFGRNILPPTNLAIKNGR